MPVISQQISTATTNALEGVQFSVQDSPALVTLAAATATEGETCTFSVGSRQFAVAAVMNLEAGSGEVDMERDILLRDEVVPAGKYFLEFPAAAANLRFVLIIEPATPSP